MEVFWKSHFNRRGWRCSGSAVAEENLLLWHFRADGIAISKQKEKLSAQKEQEVQLSLNKGMNHDSF